MDSAAQASTYGHSYNADMRPASGIGSIISPGAGSSIDSIVRFSLKDPSPIKRLPADALRTESYMIDAAAREEEIQDLEMSINASLISHGWDEERSYPLAYSAKEAVINAKKHSFLLEPGKRVELYVKFAPEYAEISVISRGGKTLKRETVLESVNHAENTPVLDMGYEISGKEQAEEQKGSCFGFGFYQMKLMCDDVEFGLGEAYTEVVLRKSRTQLEECVTVQRQQPS